MKLDCDNNFYCCVAEAAPEANSRWMVSSDERVFGFVRSFSGVEYWHRDISSVRARITIGECFSISSSQAAAYFLCNTEKLEQLSITVACMCKPAYARPVSAMQLTGKVSAPRSLRRVSCGLISTKCASFRL